MADQTEALRETLRQLHEQLVEADTVDPKVQTLLRNTLEEIHAMLERSRDEDAGASDHQSLTDRLSETAKHFEESHPTLAEAVGRVADALSRLGI